MVADHDYVTTLGMYASHRVCDTMHRTRLVRMRACGGCYSEREREKYLKQQHDCILRNKTIACVNMSVPRLDYIVCLPCIKTQFEITQVTNAISDANVDTVDINDTIEEAKKKNLQKKSRAPHLVQGCFKSSSQIISSPSPLTSSSWSPLAFRTHRPH